MKKVLLFFSLLILLSPSLSQAAPAENRLKGKILLQVEGHGEAWYVRPDDGKRMYMKDGDAAYQLMRNYSLGISNLDLSKIPVGFEDRFECLDSDGDGLCNQLEVGLGTNVSNSDSDGDGYNDGEELRNNYDPLSNGALNYDFNLADRLKGRILLQVESHGEAWYIHPDDGKRYYMPDGASAYQIMRFLSLGITNNDLAKIDIDGALPEDSGGIIVESTFLRFLTDDGAEVEVDIDNERMQYRVGDRGQYETIDISKEKFDKLSEVIINNKPWSFDTIYGDDAYFDEWGKPSYGNMTIMEIVELGAYNFQVNFSQGSKNFFSNISSDSEQQDKIEDDVVATMCIGSCPSGILEIIEEIKLIVEKELVFEKNTNQQITGTVDLFAIDDFENNIATYSYGLNIDGIHYDLQISDKQLDDYVGEEVMVSGLIEDDVIIAESIQPTLSKSTTDFLPSVLGEQKYVVIYMLDGTEDSNFDVNTHTDMQFGALNNFIMQESNGMASVSASVKTINFDDSLCSFGDIMYRAVKHVDEDIDFNNYDGLIVYIPVTGCMGHPALGSIGKSYTKTQDGDVNLYKVLLGDLYNDNITPDKTLAHEVGHNFGFTHAGNITCGDFPDRKNLDNQCHYDQYGDIFNVMGRGTYKHHYSINNKIIAGWIDDSDLIISNSGSYVISAVENEGASKRGIKIPILWDKDSVYLEGPDTTYSLVDKGFSNYFLEYWSAIDTSSHWNQIRYFCPDNTYGLTLNDLERGLMIRISQEGFNFDLFDIYGHMSEFNLNMHPNVEFCGNPYNSCVDDFCLNDSYTARPFAFLLEGETYYDYFNNMKITLLEAGDKTARVNISRIFNFGDPYEQYGTLSE